MELVEAAIARIERDNPKLNAVVTPLFDAARETAKAMGSFAGSGPFAGVPFLLKDLLSPLAGVPMASGSKFMKDFVPDHDSELVTRLKRAGLIILGKTNTPEFGLQATTEPRLFGPTRNPWDLTRTAGGSSGGSAAAVASGMVPMAHGNDGGGSIRIPASCCGIFGLKPTRARVPLGPDMGDILSGMVVEGALTRSVRDAAILLDAVSGPAPGDPYAAPPAAAPYGREVETPPGRLRIAFTTGAATGKKPDADCRAAVLDAAKLLTDLGHEVGEQALQVDAERLVHAFMVVWTAGAAKAVADAAQTMKREAKPEGFEPLTWALREIGRKYGAVDYLQAVQTFQQISRDVARQFEAVDLWLMPTLAQAPLPIGYLGDTPEDPLRGFFRAGDFAPFTPLANITGQCAMSVPLYWNGDGLPIGSQFMGRFGDEAVLFRLAAQLEAARPWDKRRPNF
jgi:amidase